MHACKKETTRAGHQTQSLLDPRHFETEAKLHLKSGYKYLQIKIRAVMG
jgi:hypothetical protein